MLPSSHSPQGRKAMFTISLRDVEVDEDVDMDELASLTEGSRAC